MAGRARRRMVSVAAVPVRQLRYQRVEDDTLDGEMVILWEEAWAGGKALKICLSNHGYTFS